MGEERRRLRSDAAANRDRLLAGAVRSMLQHGRNVSLAMIAEESGVGVATLYRRFPDRDALMGALEAQSYRLLADVLDAALAETSTGIAAVEAFLVGSFALREELVLPLHGSGRSAVPEARDAGLAVRDRIAAVVERGHEDGSLRPDVTGRTIVEFGALLVEGLPGDSTWERSAEEQRRVFLRGVAP